MCAHGTFKMVEVIQKRINQVVQVDACIADEVKYLNDKGVVTVGSCCGHGHYYPHVLVEESSVKLANEIGYTLKKYYHGPNDFRGLYEILLQKGRSAEAPLGLAGGAADAVSAVIISV
jgi:hypothetical protein